MAHTVVPPPLPQVSDLRATLANTSVDKTGRDGGASAEEKCLQKLEASGCEGARTVARRRERAARANLAWRTKRRAAGACGSRDDRAAHEERDVAASHRRSARATATPGGCTLASLPREGIACLRRSGRSRLLSHSVRVTTTHHRRRRVTTHSPPRPVRRREVALDGFWELAHEPSNLAGITDGCLEEIVSFLSEAWCTRSTPVVASAVRLVRSALSFLSNARARRGVLRSAWAPSCLRARPRPPRATRRDTRPRSWGDAPLRCRRERGGGNPSRRNERA